MTAFTTELPDARDLSLGEKRKLADEAICASHDPEAVNLLPRKGRAALTYSYRHDEIEALMICRGYSPTPGSPGRSACPVMALCYRSMRYATVERQVIGGLIFNNGVPQRITEADDKQFAHLQQELSKPTPADRKSQRDREYVAAEQRRLQLQLDFVS